ncbi:MAG: hypothetical protein NUV60_03470 [Patescibacteria group bacterium]|nr:hypothetical protein [Patescibacteria group bacterium]
MSFPFAANLIALLFSFFIVGTLFGVFFRAFRNSPSHHNSPRLTRASQNPILKPTKNEWENKAVFNPGALVLGGRTHLFYRAIGEDGVSRFGYASSKDGVVFDERLSSPVYTIRYPRIAGAPTVARYAPTIYASGGSWGGCEDARLVLVENRVYLVFYAFDEKDIIRVTVASIAPDDFIAHRFDRWSPPVFISPPGHIHKNWVLFPEKIGGKFAVLHSIIGDDNNRVRIEYTDDLADLSKRTFVSPDPMKVPSMLVAWHTHAQGAGPPPIKTELGWLVFYHAHDAAEPTRYKWGALLLDLADPTKIVARAAVPVFEPDAPYENEWKPGIAYACGAAVTGDTLSLYYGSGEMTVSTASVPFRAFVQALSRGELRAVSKPKLVSSEQNSPHLLKSDAFPLKSLFVRAPENPILNPRGTGFESRATFNAAAIDMDGSIHILYRAMSTDHISTIGYARSKDGIHLDERLTEPAYRPRAEFEQKYSHLNSGCEDPRAVIIDGRLYMTYVAAGDTGKAKGVITSISCDDFLAKRFDRWSMPTPVTTENIDDKDLCLLPEKVRGEYMLYHRIGDRICAALVGDLSFTKRISRCIEILHPRAGAWDSKKVGVAGPPIKTQDGWLMFYHGIGENGVYGLGAAFLDPSGLQVQARLDAPVLMPQTLYEKHGERDNVVFSCGAAVRGDTIFLYYGAADKVTGVATASLAHILDSLS